MNINRYDFYCSYDGGGPAEETLSADGGYVKYEDHAATLTQLQQRISELEAERDAAAGKALEMAARVPEKRFCGHPLDDADLKSLATEIRSLDLSAILKEVEVQPIKLDDIEQYRMQMAGISTAAIGYWKPADGVHPDYDTLALRDVAALYAKYDELYKARPTAPTEHKAGETSEASEQADVIVCQIGDYAAVDSREMATVIYDDRKLAECYTNEDAEFIGSILRSAPPAAETVRHSDDMNDAVLRGIDRGIGAAECAAFDVLKDVAAPAAGQPQAAPSTAVSEAQLDRSEASQSNLLALAREAGGEGRGVFGRDGYVTYVTMTGDDLERFTQMLAKQANGVAPCGQVVAVDPPSADGPGVNWLGVPPGVGTLLFAAPSQPERKNQVQLGAKVFSFSSFTDWVNSSSKKFSALGVPSSQIICVDRRGLICGWGAHFEQADRDDAFPVDAYHIRPAIAASTQSTSRENDND